MNVAIVKLSSVGDVVHALPVAAALRTRFPHGRITWVVERREAILAEGNPNVILCERGIQTCPGSTWCRSPPSPTCSDVYAARASTWPSTFRGT